MCIDLIELLFVCWLKTLQAKRVLQAHSSKLLSPIMRWIVEMQSIVNWEEIYNLSNN